MTNPKEVLEKNLMEVQRDYQMGGLSEGLYGDYAKDVTIRTIISTLTSQLEAIPEDDDFAQNHNEIFFQDGINLERQRQRQELQLAINKWSELK